MTFLTQKAHISCRRMKQLSHVVFPVWLVVVAGGLLVLIDYSTRPASSDVTARSWPEESMIQRSPNSHTLLVFLHPRCMCSRATMRQLATVAARFADQCVIRVVFYCPSDQADSWVQSDLWTGALRVSPHSPVIDRGAVETKRFGISTSGHVLLFDRQSICRYSGGITGSRGHDGDNTGLRAVLDLLQGDSIAESRYPVFGCSIVGLSDVHEVQRERK